LTANVAVSGTAIAAEYYAADFDLFFHSADVAEKRLIDDGAYGTAWQRTESYWRVWTTPAPDRVAVCRFFDFEAYPRTSHRYGYGDECAIDKAGGDWAFEKVAYYVAAPAADGACPAGTEPLYRLRDESQAGAPAYRYTPLRGTRDAMVARGWEAQGFGADATFACTPALGVHVTERSAPPVVSTPKAPPVRGVIPIRGRPF
jgi:hypothetical protein